jgi:type II secretion system protein N
VKERLVRVAKWAAFPLFYVFSLALFGYLTFPYGRLKDRLVVEFDKRGKPGQRIEIGKLTSYWLSGVELTNVKLHIPPEEPSPGFPGVADFGGAAAPSKEMVIAIDEAHVRVRLLPLLIGRVRVDFAASAFGGDIKGTVPVGDAKGDVEVELEHVDIGKIEALGQMVGVPLKGTATGKLALSAGDGKFNKANGTLDLTIADMVVSDGKTKIQGLIELPQAKLGDLTLTAEAKEGVLKVTKFAATGADLELVGDGKITLKEPWSDAVADLFLRFKFTDAYRGKTATTKLLLGEPGSTTGGMMESQVPKMKRAKRPDGFYGWHVYGPLKRLKFDPSTADFAASAATPGAKRGKADSPFPLPKKPTPGLPLGASTAKGDDTPAPPPPPPERFPADLGRGAPPPEPPPARAPAMPQVLAPQPAAAPQPEPPPPPPAPEPQPVAPEQPPPLPEQPAQ